MCSVAMYLAYNKIVPTKEWHHDPKLKNEDNETVGYVLSKNNI